MRKKNTPKIVTLKITFLSFLGFFSPQGSPTPPKAEEGETNLSEHPLEMTISPAKSKIHPPALGLDPPQKRGKTKNTKKAQNGLNIKLFFFEGFPIIHLLINWCIACYVRT